MIFLLSLILLICLYTTSESTVIPRVENEALPCSLVVDDRFNPTIVNRNFVTNRWPKGVVPYEITSSYSNEERELITKAMRDIESRSCIKFVRRQSHHQNYVDINSNQQGCHATLGFNKHLKRHYLNLERPGCMFLSTIEHELLHNLGFDHEQNRPDRDNYIQINWRALGRDSYYSFFRSIKKGTRSKPPKCDPKHGYSFDHCYSGFVTETFGLPYDYKSIMHYKKDSFALYPGYDVMKAKRPEGKDMGTSRKMTDLDHDKLYRAYKCRISTTTTTSVAPCEDIYTNCNELTTWCNDKSENSRIPNHCQKTCRHC